MQETFDFAANCRIGVNKRKEAGDSKDILSENLTIDGLDLAVQPGSEWRATEEGDFRGNDGGTESRGLR